MRWVDAAGARLRLLLFREEVEQRMDEEFRFHLDMETERLVREAGVNPREARRRARAAFGGVEAHKDAVRDGRGGWAWLGRGVGRDIRDGIRSLAKRPAFTAVAILSLALGIGANTAIFSLVNAVILRDSPIERPEEVVNLYLHQASFEFGTLSYPDFEDVRDGTAEVFSDIAASYFVPLTIDRGEGGGVRLAPAEAVTGSYFPMLGIEAAVGRTLLPSDDVSRGGHPVVMLDYRYWQSAFAGDPDVVGHEMRVGGRAYTVIGVGPPDFAGTVRGLTPTFYVPYMMAEELNGFPVFDDRGHTSLFVKARLRRRHAAPGRDCRRGGSRAAHPGPHGEVGSGRAVRAPPPHRRTAIPADGRLHPGGGVAVDGGRRAGAVAGVHQPRQFPARARPRPAQGGGGAPGVGRVARVARAASPDRDDAAEPAGRGRRCPAGGLVARPAGHRGPSPAAAGHARSPSRRERPRVHVRRLGRGRRPARSGAGAAKHPAGRGRRPQKRERRGRPTRSAPVAQRAGRHATHDLAGAAPRRRLVPPPAFSGCSRSTRASAASRPP